MTEYNYNSENTGSGGTVSTHSSNLTQFDNNNEAALVSEPGQANVPTAKNENDDTPIITDGMKKIIDTGESYATVPTIQEHSTATTGQATEQQQTEETTKKELTKDETEQLVTNLVQQELAKSDRELLRQVRRINNTLEHIAKILSIYKRL